MKPTPLIHRYLHIKLDSFLASIIERENPKLIGRPILISEASKEGARVLSCNQPAKKLGIRKDDTVASAQQRCSWVAVYPSDVELAKTYAKKFIELLCRFSANVSPHNRLDEAYLELDGNTLAASSPEEFAVTIQRSIKSQLGFNASIGIARSRSVAWTAARQKLPDGITSVPVGSERAFLYPLTLDQLYSLGTRTREFLEERNIRTIGQLAALPRHWLVEHFGSAGYEIAQLSMGQDPRQETIHSMQKSISRSLRFASPTSNPVIIETTVQHLSTKALKALEKQGRQAGTLVLQVTDLHGRSHQTHAKLSPQRNSFQRSLYRVYQELSGKVTDIRSVAVQLHALLESPQKRPEVVWQSKPIQSAILGLEWRSSQTSTQKQRFHEKRMWQMPLLGMRA